MLSLSKSHFKNDDELVKDLKLFESVMNYALYLNKLEICDVKLAKNMQKADSFISISSDIKDEFLMLKLIFSKEICILTCKKIESCNIQTLRIYHSEMLAILNTKSKLKLAKLSSRANMLSCLIKNTLLNKKSYCKKWEIFEEKEETFEEMLKRKKEEENTLKRKI